MIECKTAANGGKYWKGATGMIFLDSTPETVSVKLRTSRNGVSKTRQGLCFSKKSGKLRIYHWTKSQGIKDISYEQEVIPRIWKMCRVADLDFGCRREQSTIKPYSEIAAELSIVLNREITEDTIEIDVLTEILPFLRRYKWINGKIPRRLRDGLKHDELPKAVQTIFGRSHRHLIKLVGQLLHPRLETQLDAENLAWVALAAAFNDWEIDFIHQILEQKPVWITPQKAYQLLRHYSPRRVLRLVETQIQTRPYTPLLHDASWMYDSLLREIHEFRLPDCPRNIKQLHDWIQRDYKRVYQEKVEKTVLPSDKLSSIDGVQLVNLTFRVPTTGKTLIEWGNKLNNCIAAYAEKVVEKKCYLLGVEQNKTIKYVIEINRKAEINQFVGIDNSAPEPVIEILVSQFLSHELCRIFNRNLT